jgi:hypothetical protein
VRDSVVALQLVFHVGQARLGRRRLAIRTGLSEMTVRLELERLRELGFVRLRRSGAEFTRAGREHFAPLFDRVRAILELELTSLRLDAVTLAAHLEAPERSPVWTIRDRAIREGATGLILLRFGPGPEGWSFTHNDEPIEAQNPRDAAAIVAALPAPCVGDRLLIVSGPDRRRAGLGLWRVIREIVWDS